VTGQLKVVPKLLSYRLSGLLLLPYVLGISENFFATGGEGWSDSEWSLL